MSPWIKLKTDLFEDQNVLSLADFLKIPDAFVVGLLVRFWSWADKNTVDGKGIKVSDKRIDAIVGRKKFAAGLRHVGWLAGADGDLEIPNFERHNGASAKRRALGQRRNERYVRDASVTDESSQFASHDDDDYMTLMDENCDGESVTKTSLEKRREEKRRVLNTSLSNSVASSGGSDFPETENFEDDLITLKQALTQAFNAGVPEDFAAWLYEDWSCRNGCDASGVAVRWVNYAKKRWNREGPAWKAGTHKGAQKQASGAVLTVQEVAIAKGLPDAPEGWFEILKSDLHPDTDIPRSWEALLPHWREYAIELAAERAEGFIRPQAGSEGAARGSIFSMLRQQEQTEVAS
jgi:hypothetical protein